MPKKLPRMDSTRLAALAMSAVDLFDGNPDRKPPKEFRIFPAGKVSTTKGEFMFDADAAKAVMAAYEQHGVDLTIDYDHHTLLTQVGVKAVSAGWFHLDMRNGELWATDVSWNPPAVQHFANGEYRYFSPLFDYERKSNRITNLINNALTNTPAMDGIDALVAASANPTAGETTMSEEEIKKLQAQVDALAKSVEAKDRQIVALQGQTATVALAATVGLSATAPDAEVRTAVTGLVTFRKSVLETLGKGDEATALGALTALKKTAGEAEALTAKIAEIETAALSSEWKNTLDELSVKGKDGKYLEPAKRPEVEKLTLKFGGGTLSRAAVDFGKELAVGMLSARTGGAFTPAGGAGGGLVSQLEAEIASKMSVPLAAIEKSKQETLRGYAR